MSSDPASSEGTQEANDRLSTAPVKPGKYLPQKDMLFLTQLRLTGVDKLFAEVIFKLLPFLTPPENDKTAAYQTVTIWKYLDPDIQGIEQCTPLQTMYLEIMEMKITIKRLIKENKAMEAKLRVEKHGIQDLLKLAQIHLEKSLKNVTTNSAVSPSALPTTNEDYPTPAEEKLTDRFLQVDDQAFQQWLTANTGLA